MRWSATAPPGLAALRYVLVAITCATALVYLGWRVTVVNPAQPLWSWTVYVAEVIGFVWSLTFLLTAVVLPDRRPPAPPRNARVDVFIPTYDEPLDVVRRTLMGAISIRYPHETWLLDDGHRAEMEALAGRLGCRYLARDRNVDAKAGNLNNGLAHARGSFVAVFDADHVADPAFLDRTLGYFDAGNVAFVQTPQEFFNADSHQHLSPERTTSHEHSLFHRVIQRGRDAANAAMFCGSSAVLRRSALDAIGGFATGTVTEDMHTSVRLHAAGWSSVFHPEVLSAGIAPLDARSFRRQRLRWAQGAMQVSFQEQLLSLPGLTPYQRLYYALHVLNHLEGWRHAFFFLLPAAVLLTGLSPLRTGAAEYLIHFAPYFLASLLAYNEIGRGHGRLFESEIYNLARCQTSMRSVFARRRRDLPFRVTPKVHIPHNDLTGSSFVWSVFALTVVALGTALVRELDGALRLPGGSFAIVIAWAAAAVMTSARLLLLGRRCARNRRVATRLACDYGATLVAPGREARSHAVTVVAATADGFTIGTSPGDELAPGRYDGAIVCAGRTLRFAIDLHAIRRDRTGGGPVVWRDTVARAAFDLDLHQGAIAALARADRGDRGGILSEVLMLRPAFARGAARAAVAVLTIGTLLCVSRPARGADAVLLSGADITSQSSYTYLGALAAMGGSLGTSGPLLRVWGDRLTYSYVTGGARIGATSWGESLSAGYQVVSGSDYLTVFAGVQQRTTALAPFVPSGSAGTRTGTRFEIDADRGIAPRWRVDAIASDVTGTGEYWTRFQLLETPSGTLRIGPEVTWQGSPDYHGNRVGLTVGGIGLGKTLQAGINGGYQRINGLASGYAALSLSAGI